MKLIKVAKKMDSSGRESFEKYATEVLGKLGQCKTASKLMLKYAGDLDVTDIDKWEIENVQDLIDSSKELTSRLEKILKGLTSKLK